MSPTEQDWRAIYAPRLGSVLSQVVLLCHEFETADVAAGLNLALIAVEGGVGLVFENHEPFALTWMQHGGYYAWGLTPSQLEFCGPFGLDQVKVGHEGDWGSARGAVLESVSLRTFEDAREGPVVGVGHHLRSEGRRDVLWVFIGQNGSVSPFDGQIVSINAAPEGADELVEWRVIQ